MKKQKIFWIDLFCGFGGVSTGIHLAGQEVIACVNHDAEAIRCHQLNHPDCLHFTEDVTDWQVIVKLKKLVEKVRRDNPGCIINIWSSAECTHLSKAKGGTSRDADSRSLSEHLLIYEENLKPDAIYIENVEEILSWGPVAQVSKKYKGETQWKYDTGKNKRVLWLNKPYEKMVEYCEREELTSFDLPVKELKGTLYNKWVQDFKDRNYSYDYRLLNAADYGANTRRVRYFGVFKRDGGEILFPEQTHIKRSLPNPNNLPTWKPVRDILQLEEEGVSIFGLNGKNLPWATKTMIRSYKGAKKFYLTEDQFLTSYYGKGTHHSLKDPCNTLTCKERYAKVTLVQGKKWLVDTQFDNRGKSIDEPCQTLIARMDKKPVYMISTNEGGEVDNSVEKTGVRPIERLMRYFMRKHGITDIKIRMLFLEELMEIQGFPKDYVLTGKKADKLKFIGNSVVPLMAQRLVEVNHLQTAA